MSSSAGSIGLGLVGAAVLAPIGMPALGFALGSALGGFLFAPDGPVHEGPRIGDAEVSSSSLGSPIPESYGVVRTSGNMIWSAGLKETKTTSSVEGGKGGGAKSVDYSYSASFAVAFGRGPATKVLRIWADEKLIYSAFKTVNDNRYRFVFRPGTGKQGVHSLVEESVNRRLAGLPDVNEGSGSQVDYNDIDEMIADLDGQSDPRSAIYADLLRNRKAEVEAGLDEDAVPDYRFTPAYRDLCYIVFNDIPLEDFGNRLPQISAEIAWTDPYGEDGAPAAGPKVTDVTQRSNVTTAPTDGMGVDIKNRRLYVQSGTKLRKFRSADEAEGSHKDGGTSLRILGVNSFGRTLAADGGTLVVVTPTLDVDGYAVADQGQLDGYTPYQPVAGGARFAAPIKAGDASGYMAFVGGGRVGVVSIDKLGGNALYGGYYVNQVAGDEYYTSNEGGEGGGGNTSLTANYTVLGDGPMCSGPGGDVFLAADDGSQWALYRLSAKQERIATGQGDSETRVALAVNRLHISILNGKAVSSVFYDSRNERVYVLLRDLSDNSGRIVKMRPNGNVNWNRKLSKRPPLKGSGLQFSDTADGRIAYVNGTDVVEIALGDGAETIHEGVLDAAGSNDVQYYLGERRTLYTWINEQPVAIRLAPPDAGGYAKRVRVIDIIRDVCNRCGLKDSDIDLTAVGNAERLRGYTIARPSTGRAALEPILATSFVEGVETDWVARFGPRTAQPARTIEEADFGTMSSPNGDVAYAETRRPEHDLPSEMRLAYIDRNRQYEQGSVVAKRTLDPAPTMYSLQKENVELPIVFNSSAEALDIGWKLLSDTWMQRAALKLTLPWRHADLDPTDVVRLNLSDGRKLTDRLLKSTIGANFSVEVETVRANDPVHETAEFSESPFGSVPAVEIKTPSLSKTFVFDTPYFEDFQSTGGAFLRYYLAVGSDSTQWSGAQLYRSTDAEEYNRINAATKDVTWGYVEGTLGRPAVLWATDDVNTLTVQLSVDNGDVASITYDQLVAGGNKALILNEETGEAEIIQFQLVTVNADGSVTLSNLVRGLRGTDYYAGSHGSGEVFILIDDSSYLSESADLSTIGATNYYKAVAAGQLVGAAPETLIGFRGRSLMPYAPASVARTDDGVDLTVFWKRRTRVGGAWNMTGTGVENVPLSEASESYETYLINPGTPLSDFDPTKPATYAVLKTSTTPSVTFNSTELSGAGISLTDHVKVAVYQISDVVGRGFPRLISLAP